MTLIALASIKGSPGVTTAATALAASWPEGRQVLLVEADPFGGDLAPRYAMAPTGGLSSLFAAARRTLVPEDVWAHVDHLPGGLPVLFGLAGMHQATANEKAWPAVADALGALDADVVVDVGRLLPNLGGGVREVLAHADALVILCQSTLEAIVHLREALPGLAAELRGRRLFVVPTGTAQFSAADIARTPPGRSAPTLAGRPGGRCRRWPTGGRPSDSTAHGCSDGPRTRSGRSESKHSSATEFDALEVSESEVGTGPADSGPDRGPDVRRCLHANGFHRPPPTEWRSSDRTDGAELAGATSGSKWETGR